MSLEVATFIHQLQPTNPTVADKVKQGDDHLRMLKAALLNTFPNIKGPVLVSHTDLNNLPQNLAAKINALYDNREAKGSIKMHDIANAPIPAGWSPCDGGTVSGYGVAPDMRNMFIRGWDADNPPGTIGGEEDPVTNSAGGYTPVIHETALTIAQMPRHDHANPEGARYVDTAGTNDGITGGAQAGHRDDSHLTTGETGGGLGHGHGADAVPPHTHTVPLPQHYRVIFIVKTTDFVLP